MPAALRASRKKTRPEPAAYHPSETIRRRLREALEEDTGRGDVTTGLVVSQGAQAEARILVREEGFFCGAPVLEEIFRIADAEIEMEFPVAEGAAVRRNAVVVRLKGPVSSLLRAERTALNLLGRLSGIATQTRAYVKAVKGYPVLILDTRKTTPLWREVEKYAVRLGGGRNHRMGLYDAVFVKENHRLYGDLQKLRDYSGSVEIEVRSLEEVREALKLRPRVILFDNFSPARLNQAVHLARRVSPTTILEASGGMTLENVAHYAAMGVDWISVGALTHSVKALNFSLLID